MHIETYHADRDALLPLFELADDSLVQVRAYMSLGEVLVARAGETIAGHLQIVGTNATGVFEIKSVAVRETHQGRGIGRRLIEAAVVRCRKRNGHRLIVSTAAADIGNLRFYQRQGFRMYRIVQDAFGPSSGYPEAVQVDGIPLRDQVVFERAL
ncbi:MAG: GNAT family N-acetyltransferase [Xanthobacteraceae bacterium]|nr:GNAT family N-acetyltransferase [Xanthobacteraceae bacterium]